MSTSQFFRRASLLPSLTGVGSARGRATLRHRRGGIVGAVVLALAGCVSNATDDERELSDDTMVSTHRDEIIGGSPRTDYPEVVMVNSTDGQCTGTLVAPFVVLTAGHCTLSNSGGTVTAPIVGRSAQMNGKMTLDRRVTDVGLVKLLTPIILNRYPTLGGPVGATGNSERVQIIGRVRDGALSNTEF